MLNFGELESPYFFGTFLEVQENLNHPLAAVVMAAKNIHPERLQPNGYPKLPKLDFFVAFSKFVAASFRFWTLNKPTILNWVVATQIFLECPPRSLGFHDNNLTTFAYL